MQRIFFIISILILLVLFMLLKKKDNQVNIFTSIILSIILFFAYNTFIVFLLSIINVEASMLIRTIINLIISGVLVYIIRTNKKIQSYYFKIIDIVILILFIIFTVFIYNYRFKNDNLIFETTDPSVHFFMGEQFYNYSKLSMDVTEKSLYSTNSFDLFASYTTLGTFLQIFGNKSVINHVKLFVIFEMIVYSFSGIFLYFSVIKKDTKIYKKIIIFCLCLTYLLGYPLSNLIFGFHYMGMSILLINAIMYLFNCYYDSSKANNLIYYISLILLNFNIFTLYYLFVPIIYGAEGIYILYRWVILKKINFKECFKNIFILLVIPFIIGIFIYFVYPKLISESGSGISTFKLEGYIYRNLLGNFIMFIPFVLYSLIISIKNKKLTVSHFVYPFIIIFMFAVFYKIYIGDFATYYYYKFYYLLSMFVFLLIGKEINDSKFNIYSIFGIYMSLLAIMQFGNVENHISNKMFLLNPINSISSINNVIQYNQEIIGIREPIFTNQQLNDLEELIDKFEIYHITSDNTVSSFSLLQKLWLYSISKVSTAKNSNTLSSFYEDIDIEEIYKDNNNQYFLSANDISTENKLIDKYTLIYYNNSYSLYYKIN